ncbi:cation acetate symporter [bacterium]|nr:cation acetate symporter [candidate division CSSED10-310 bacterium]
MTITIFLAFVVFVIGLSFYLGRKAKSSAGFFAAGGKIHWSVNGIAFAGDYLSAASFLGICGMIATVGYDGFLYSIGYLAGWIVALFVVAEPMKRLGKYTFTDALDANFNSKGIQLVAAISTLIVSICYLIPQMVGAGVLVEPLLGLPHSVGVIMVGAIVILIVATAGMASTTYVQFLKGALLIVFSVILTVAVLNRGLSTEPDQGGTVPFHTYASVSVAMQGDTVVPLDASYTVVQQKTIRDMIFVQMSKDGLNHWWKVERRDSGIWLDECQSILEHPDGQRIINGAPASDENALRQVGNLESIEGQSGKLADTGPIGPFAFLSKMASRETVVRVWKDIRFQAGKDSEDKVQVFYSVSYPGNRVMRPGLMFKVEGTTLEKLEFFSLMLALFFGTAALPHILIRYYTVPSQACARKSTIVAIAAIGFFYVLTMYMGLGAMVNNVVNPITNNMSAPLLARSFGAFLFAVISAIAFATVLGTVSGLIVAASGAVAHDIMDKFLGLKMTDQTKVVSGKVAAITVGLVAIILGIVFRGMNVSYLVGWAFAVAASANLPAILMLLFWKRTTSRGIAASVVVGIVSALGIILLSPSMYIRYGLDPLTAPIPISNPGIISIPLSFMTLIVVSLMTQNKRIETAKRRVEPFEI